MKDKRFFFGLCVTSIWLFFVVGMYLTQKRPGALNEWGDFFAGFFAPIAFLWLILGYMQQGEELRHSTEALRLQAEELKNSVEQQSQLVAISREQVQQELAALNEERERRREAARPKFVPQLSNAIRTGQITDYRFKIVNVGALATNVRMFLKTDAHAAATGKRKQSLLGSGEETTIDFQTGSDTATGEVNITYVDSDAIPGSVRFTFNVENRRVTFGEIVRLT